MVLVGWLKTHVVPLATVAIFYSAIVLGVISSFNGRTRLEKACWCLASLALGIEVGRVYVHGFILSLLSVVAYLYIFIYERDERIANAAGLVGAAIAIYAIIWGGAKEALWLYASLLILCILAVLIDRLIGDQLVDYD